MAGGTFVQIMDSNIVLWELQTTHTVSNQHTAAHDCMALRVSSSPLIVAVLPFSEILSKSMDTEATGTVY